MANRPHYLSSQMAGYPIADRIIADFKRTRGLRVMGVGVGYGPLMFVLRKYLGVKAEGIEQHAYAKPITRRAKLPIRFGVDATQPGLGQTLGKKPFDATYSVHFLEFDVLKERSKADAVLENVRALTRIGGKSYHVVMDHQESFLSKKDFERHGFRLDRKETVLGENTLLVLTRVA